MSANGSEEHEEVLSSLMAKLKTTSEQIKVWSETSRKLRAAMVSSLHASGWSGPMGMVSFFL